MKTNIIHGALFGVAIGDALGVPAEFKSRSALELEPVQDFEGYKSHRQPPGTFSDDSLYVKGFGATADQKIHQAAMKNFA